MHLSIYPVAAVLAFTNFGHWAKSGIIDVAAVAFVLGVLVFVHEFGHYAVAKLCGVRVETFSLGFGKRLWGFRRGDTDYRISLLPVGGYVKMAGENPMESRTGDPGEFTSHPRWQRFLIAIAGPAMNILLAIVVWTGVYMVHHEYAAVFKSPVDVISVNPGSPAEKAGIRRGDRIVKIENIQNPTWQQALVRIEINPNQPVAVTLQRNGQKLETTLVPGVSGPDRMGDAGLELPAVAGTVEAGLPAEKAGIRPGDVLLAVDSKPIQGMRDLLQALEKAKTNTVQLSVLRSGQELTFPVTPRLLDTPGEAEKRYRIGISLLQVEKLPFTAAVTQAAEEMKGSSLLVFELVGKLIEHKNPIQQMSSPIGIAKAAGDAATQGWPSLLEVMAMISLQLAIFNLFPIPILDGGLMLMLLIEGLIRRDIKQEIKERVYQAAFVFLMLFAAVVIFNDVLKSFHG
jgi:regulator of sigma E protease